VVDARFAPLPSADGAPSAAFAPVLLWDRAMAFWPCSSPPVEWGGVRVRERSSPHHFVGAQVAVGLWCRWVIKVPQYGIDGNAAVNAWRVGQWWICWQICGIACSGL